MSYKRQPPSARRRMVARALYEEEPDARPGWVDERLLRPGQVAALFQVSRRAVSDWAHAGKLGAAIFTPGGHRRFRAGDVRALLESQAVGTPPPRVQESPSAPRV